MLGLIHDEVWIGSQDSIIYIMDTHTMSCNKQLTEHRHEVTGLTADPTGGQNRWVYFISQKKTILGSNTRRTFFPRQTFSCSCDGTILQWDSVSLKVKQQLFVSCDRLASIQVHNSALWCCKCFLCISAEIDCYFAQALFYFLH